MEIRLPFGCQPGNEKNFAGSGHLWNGALPTIKALPPTTLAKVGRRDTAQWRRNKSCGPFTACRAALRRVCPRTNTSLFRKVFVKGTGLKSTAIADFYDNTAEIHQYRRIPQKNKGVKELPHPAGWLDRCVKFSVLDALRNWASKRTWSSMAAGAT